MDAGEFLKILLDPKRLGMVGLVALGPKTGEELAAAAKVKPRQVLAAFAPLIEAGIVTRDDGIYTLDAMALRDLARTLPQPEPPAEVVFFGMTEEEGAVLARYFEGRRLREIPMNQSKRRVILERIALDFEPGVHYPEKDVNEMLTRYHDDYAALRRYLVDERFLDRAEGQYWRAGGRVH